MQAQAVQGNYEPIYQPHAKQMMLHNAPSGDNDNLSLILYGGQRAGGKSAGLLADAFFFALAYPGAKICIIRESLDAVKSSFLDKLGTLFPEKTTDGQRIYTYREKSSSMKAPLSRSVIFENGSYITFQRVANYAEAIAKQGWEFHYVIVDEVTKQEERTFDYLLSTVRSARVYNPHSGRYIHIPTRVACGCNPGGIGHKWVKERFIDPTVVEKSTDGHNTPIKTKDAKEIIQIPDRNNAGKSKDIGINFRFIPASWKDNPFINDSYVANLMKLPEHKKEMDLYGNWDVVAGRMFRYTDKSYIDDFEAYNMIKKYNPDIYISIDWGYKPSYHSAGWYAVFPDKSVIRFKEMYGQELIFEDFVKEIKDRSRNFHITATCLPHDLFRSGDKYRADDGKVIGEMKSDVFDHYGLNPIGVTSGKGTVSMRYDKIHSASEIEMPDGRKKFRLTYGGCESLTEELDNAVTSEINPEKMAKSCKDHAIDDFGLFLTFYSEDISPIGIEDLEVIDTRGKWQRRIEDYEDRLFSGESYWDEEQGRLINSVDDDYEVC